MRLAVRVCTGEDDTRWWHAPYGCLRPGRVRVVSRAGRVRAYACVTDHLHGLLIPSTVMHW
jgi:hypothetical protein